MNKSEIEKGKAGKKNQRSQTVTKGFVEASNNDAK